MVYHYYLMADSSSNPNEHVENAYLSSPESSGIAFVSTGEWILKMILLMKRFLTPLLQ